MSIEIYSKACIIKKDDTFYYFLKHHSKNDCVCKYQTIIDGNFKNKYLMRDGRGGSWSIKAHGTESDVTSDKIAMTDWNCPTSQVYGQIQFGNKKNIALYWAKQNRNKWKDITEYTEEQQGNIKSIIDWYNRPDNTYRCDLSNISADKHMRAVHTYCDDNKIKLEEHNPIHYCGYYYWNLDNL